MINDLYDYWIRNPEKWKRVFKATIKQLSGMTWNEAGDYANIMDVESWNGTPPHTAANEEMSYL